MLSPIIQIIPASNANAMWRGGFRRVFAWGLTEDGSVVGLVADPKSPELLRCDSIEGFINYSESKK